MISNFNLIGQNYNKHLSFGAIKASEEVISELKDKGIFLSNQGKDLWVTATDSAFLGRMMLSSGKRWSEKTFCKALFNFYNPMAKKLTLDDIKGKTFDQLYKMVQSTDASERPSSWWGGFNADINPLKHIF